MDIIYCPHCNMSTYAKYRHASMLACSYCKAPITKNNSLPVIVRQELIEKPREFNFDLMHKYFWFNNLSYQITGYVRYFYTEGYLYQWSAYNHNAHIWLCECLGNWFILSEEKESVDIGTPITALRPNSMFMYKGQQYTVDTLSMFHGYYMEGELPEFPYLHTKGLSIECSNQNNLIHFNIYPENRIDTFVGKSVHLKDLKISKA